MEGNEIGAEILHQIKLLTPKPAFWSWRASKFQTVGENQIKGLDDYYLGGLLFFTKGAVHYGHVFIALGLDDTYKVYTGRVEQGHMHTKDRVNNVYFDELPKVLDDLIETPKGAVTAL